MAHPSDHRAADRDLRLVSPESSLEPAFRRLVDDYLHGGEVEIAASYQAGVVDFDGYCRRLRGQEQGVGLPEGWVPASTFWMLGEGQAIVGVIRIRHRLNAFLEERGGHVGYDVPPSHRGRGHGSRLLQFGLAQARKLGLRRVLLVCDADNTASIRVIEKNGGVLRDERLVEGESALLRRYWVDL